jgi:SNF family Na+-dependent transporter
MKSKAREHWGSRIGLIFAMAGSAVGLGNFVRFPSQIAKCGGGGGFMIPYFISLFLLGLPVLWVEWAIGRYGGQKQHGSLPQIFGLLSKSRIAKYFGILGLVVPLAIASYYTYVTSWGIGYSAFSILGSYFGKNPTLFLNSYTGSNTEIFPSIWVSYGVFVAVLGAIAAILCRGLSGGVEKMVKVVMPALIIFATVLVIRVLSLGEGALDGLKYIWKPDFSALTNWNVWMLAAGQVFFTLSVGQAQLPAYASYIREDEDIALGPVQQTAINEFCELVLGGCITIPAIFFFMGSISPEMTEGYNLAFIAMPQVVEQMPGGRIFGFFWFFLLFLAGITTVFALCQPFISFLEDEFKLTRVKASVVTILVVFALSQPPVLFYHYGVFDDIDFWMGSLFLVVISLVEVLLFAWSFGMERGWKELHKGASINIPKGFYYIIKYITPAFLLFLLGSWVITVAPQYLSNTNFYIWIGRLSIILIFSVLCILVYRAECKNKTRKAQVRNSAKENI